MRFKPMRHKLYSKTTWHYLRHIDKFIFMWYIVGRRSRPLNRCAIRQAECVRSLSSFSPLQICRGFLFFSFLMAHWRQEKRGGVPASFFLQMQKDSFWVQGKACRENVATFRAEPDQLLKELTFPSESPTEQREG